VYFCDQTQPPGATPDAAGMMCYNTSDFCLQGPNGCGGVPQLSGRVINGTVNTTAAIGGFAFSSLPVSVTLTSLQSGRGNCGFDGMMYYSCRDNVTATALFANGQTYNVSNLIGAVDPAGSNFIYSLIPATTSGGFAVAVGDVVGQVIVSGGFVSSIVAGLYCQFDVVTCSTGQAGPMPSSNWFCETDYPAGSGPNGAGELCYDTALDCVNGPNYCGAAAPCVFDPATCSTGAVSAASKNYYCDFSKIGGSIPNGGGQLCFDTKTSCLNAPNACVLNDTSATGTFSCTPRPDLCGTGMASNSGNVWICAADLPQGALPDGGGNYCFDNVVDCSNAMNACNGYNAFLANLNSGNFSASQVYCVQNPSTCATGIASGSGNVWTCPLDPPPGSVPTGSGELCYDTAYNCLQGPNSCGVTTPCTYDTATCSTGQVAGFSSNWYCAATRIVGGVPNGAGAMCYASNGDCLNGTNLCAPQTNPCYQSPALCNTGQGAGQVPPTDPVLARSWMPATWYCPTDTPPNAYPNGFGSYCYTDVQSCTNGPNACNSTFTCSVNYVVCSTGVAGGIAPKASYFCQIDLPIGSLPTEQGLLCYDNFADCLGGPNACDLNTPCEAGPQQCYSGQATGVNAGGSLNMFYCPLDPPNNGLPTASGQYCYNSSADCMNAPNSCGGATAMNLTSASSCKSAPWFCASGQAGNAGYTWLCAADLPQGALNNAAGLHCYDTLANCLAGPNSCTALMGNSCTFDTATCSTGMAATAGNAFVCEAQVPVNASLSIESSAMCYTDQLACLQGPNSCTSGGTLCQQPALAGLVGICPDNFPYQCPLDVPMNAQLTPSGLCWSSRATCANGTACGYLGQACVTSPTCPAANSFICKVTSQPKSIGYMVNFTLSLPSVANATSILSPSYQLLLAQALNVPSNALTLFVSAPPTGRRLQSVLLSASIVLSNFTAAAALNASLASLRISSSIFNSAVTLSQVSLQLPPGPTPIATAMDIANALQVSQPLINITRHTNLSSVGNNALRVLPGSSVTIIGNTASCAAGGDPSGTGLCTLDAQSMSQHFSVGAQATLTLVNLALINGAALGGVDGSAFAYSGGSITAEADSQLNVVNCTFINNTAMQGFGGAVYTSGNISDATSTFVNSIAFAGFDVFLCSPTDPSFNNATGACSSCPAGQVIVSAGVCKPCPAGTYDAGDLTNCNPCPLGTQSSAVGAPNVAFCNCPANSYRTPLSDVTDPTTVSCSPCPPGANCPGEGDNRAYATAGNWRDYTVDAVVFYGCTAGYCLDETPLPLVTYAVHRLGGDSSLVTTSADAGSTLCSELHNPAACISPLRASNCRQGHTGPLCALCIPGWTIQNNYCSPCSSSQAIINWGVGPQIVAAVLGGGLVLAVICVFVWLPLLPASVVTKVDAAVEWIKTLPRRLFAKKEGDAEALAAQQAAAKKRKKPARVRLLLQACRKHFSALFVSVSMTVDSLQLIQSFKSTMAIPWPNIFLIFGPVLQGANIQVFKLPSVACIAPSLSLYTYFESLTLLVLIIIVFLFIVWALGFLWALRKGTFTRLQLIHYSRRDFIVLLALLKIAYMPLSQTTFQVFSCTQLGSASYLTNDLSRKCGTREHSYWAGVGGWWLFLYPFGIPLLYYNTLLFYHVPYLVRVKTDTEYLRRLIDICARENNALDVDHSKLTLELEPRHTEVLWKRFMDGAPVFRKQNGDFKVLRKVKLGQDEDEEEDDADETEADKAAEREIRTEQHLDEGQAPSSPEHEHAPPAEHAHKLTVHRLVFMFKRVFWHSKPVVLALRVVTAYKNRVYGIVPPKTANEFQVRELLAYARDIGIKIEALSWKVPFPGEREAYMEAVALQTCAFLFKEFHVEAWYYSLIELSKNLIISCILGFVRPQTSIQVFTGLLIMYTYQQIFLAVDPLPERSARLVGYMSYLTIFGFFFLGCILIDGVQILANPSQDTYTKSVLALILMISVFAFPLMIAIRTFYNNVQRELTGKVAIAGESDDEPDDETDDEDEPDVCARTWSDVFGNAPDAGHRYHRHDHTTESKRVKMQTPIGRESEADQQSLDSFKSLSD